MVLGQKAADIIAVGSSITIGIDIVIAGRIARTACKCTGGQAAFISRQADFFRCLGAGIETHICVGSVTCIKSGGDARICCRSREIQGLTVAAREEQANAEYGPDLPARPHGERQVCSRGMYSVVHTPVLFTRRANTRRTRCTAPGSGELSARELALSPSR